MTAGTLSHGLGFPKQKPQPRYISAHSNGVDIEKPRPQNLVAPLWAIATALWVIVVIGIIGSLKVYQMQESLRDEIAKIPKMPKIRL